MGNPRAPPAFDPVRIRHPTPGLRLAADPRIPDEHERFRFALTDGHRYASVEWSQSKRRVAAAKSPVTTLN